MFDSTNAHTGHKLVLLTFTLCHVDCQTCLFPNGANRALCFAAHQKFGQLAKQAEILMRNDKNLQAAKASLAAHKQITQQLQLAIVQPLLTWGARNKVGLQTSMLPMHAQDLMPSDVKTLTVPPLQQPLTEDAFKAASTVLQHIFECLAVLTAASGRHQERQLLVDQMKDRELDVERAAWKQQLQVCCSSVL